MPKITTRDGLIEYCLRRLGDPVIEINVDDDQVEDRIDEALEYYQEYHSDATERVYFTHQVTATDIANGWIPIDESIHYVSRLFPVSSSFLYSENMFSFQYQFALSDFHTLHNYDYGSLQYYEQMRQYISLLDMKLNGTPQVEFSRRRGRLYIWGEFNSRDLIEGDYIVAEVYQVIDPEDPNASVYNDMLLKEYATALIKRQWGTNMKKFEGMQLPGGVTISGQQIYDEADGEIREVRERIRLEHEDPIDFFVG